MRGQWLGSYTGTNSGRAIVDIDEVGRQFRGYAYMYDSSVGLPSTRADINVSIPAGNVLQTRLPLQPIDPMTGDATTWAALATSYPPGSQFPNYADVKISWNAASLTASWMTDVGTSGSMVLPVTQAGIPSTYNPEPTVTDWKGFKVFVDQLEPDRYIFRGQENSSWRLRTSFHRTQRANLERFLGDDIPRLRKHLSARTSHLFDFTKPDEHGAFVSLVQHHGYPTPLLDWTRSAFIGAFFAYRMIRNSAALSEGLVERKVRIFVFDSQQWSLLPQVHKLAPAQPHVSLLDALAIENTRMIPQQALSTITNVDDVESYIQQVEQIKQMRYLRVIDLPVRERPIVMTDLRQMGITAGSMFPGLDGACEALREQYFPLG